MTLAIRPFFDMTQEHAELVEKTIAYESAAHSPNTVRTYRSMCKKFQTWCEANGQSFLPTSAETIALYLSSLGATASFSTLDSTLAAIEAAHEKAGQAIKGDSSLYRRVRKGIRRTHKENQSVKKARALNTSDLREACCKLGDSLKDLRDKAVMTLAFFGAFRRSEIVSLDIECLEFNEKGVAISLLQSKTSDTRQVVYIACAKDKTICPVKALKDWIEKAPIKEGAIFRSLLKGGKLAQRLSGHAVSEIIKGHFGNDYSGHSGRRGCLTESAGKGTSIHILKKHGRHKTADVLMGYIEEACGFDDSSVAILGV